MIGRHSMFGAGHYRVAAQHRMCFACWKVRDPGCNRMQAGFADQHWRCWRQTSASVAGFPACLSNSGCQKKSPTANSAITDQIPHLWKGAAGSDNFAVPVVRQTMPGTVTLAHWQLLHPFAEKTGAGKTGAGKTGSYWHIAWESIPRFVAK